MPLTRISHAAVATALAACCLNAQAQSEAAGLKAPGSDAVWPRWHGRLLTTLASPLWRQAAIDSRDNQGQRLESLSLLGDYYFSAPLPTARMFSGFRATSGLIIGSPNNRSLSAYGQTGAGRIALGAASVPPMPGTAYDSGNTAATVPYLGVGYTNVSQRGGWGFSADIGMVAQSPSSMVKFGRVFSGTQTLDDVLRDMRLAPLLNVGVSYSF